MNIILFGPPGSGKGTQGDYLVKEFKLYKISTGELLRKEIEKKSVLGEKIKSTIDQGKFVSDKYINNLIENILQNNKFFNQLIFDGYPRNLNQAIILDSMLKKNNQKIFCVLCLNVDKKIIIQRILGRQVCSNCGLIFNEYFNPSNSSNHTCDIKFLQKRSDDNELTINNRFETYLNETLPVFNYYQKQNLLHEINGMNKIDDIYKEIRRIIHSLPT